MPGIVSAEDEQFRCPRCGRGLRREVTRLSRADRSEAEPTAVAADPPADDPWELDQQLRHIERVLRAEPAHGEGARPTGRREVARLDPPHETAVGCHLPTVAGQARSPRPSARASSPMLSALTWTALSFGTAAFVCGGVLLGWSLVADRQELWTLGVPIALGGQVALLIGLILQLDRIWHDGRQVAARLAEVDGRLHDLKAATTILGASRGPSGSSFYAHMASGASPQLLLSDLKGQLDLLAEKLDQQEQPVAAAPRRDPPTP